MQALDPALAATLAARLADDEPARVLRALMRRLDPARPLLVLQAAWERQAGGDEAGAREVLAEAGARGVPLPYEP